MLDEKERSQTNLRQEQNHRSMDGNGSDSRMNFVAAPTIALPKGGGAIRGIGEKFAANPVTGTGAMSVPVATSPSRSGFGPQLALSYDSGAGNGSFGFGWNLSLPAITRKTDKGLPQYNDGAESDTFILSGSEDLVPVLVEQDGEWIGETIPPRAVDGKTYRIRRYRPRVEGLFARIERWTDTQTGESHWRTITKDNLTTLYGKDENSRICDPEHPTHIFSWLICQSYDDKGNAMVYRYSAEDSAGVDLLAAHEANRTAKGRSANRYLKRILYGNRTPNRDANWSATDPAVPADWMFETFFDYDEGQYESLGSDGGGQQFIAARLDPANGSHWPARQDAFSSYHAGFEIRTYRLCRRVLMFHHFPNELGTPDYLVRSTDFTYDESRIATFLTGVTHSSYVHRPDDLHPDRYLKKSLPVLEFEYSRMPTAGELAALPVLEIDAESMENLPAGLDGTINQWVDLDGEGLSGILTEQADGWFYKRNLSANSWECRDDTRRTIPRFGPLETVASRPRSSLTNGQAQFMDLAGDGQVDLVEMGGATGGFYERTDDAGWTPFRPFIFFPNIDTGDPNLRFVDLDGDGHADILLTQEDVITWHPSLAEDGFGEARQVYVPVDEEQGPRLVFADAEQSVYLADLSGDGLTDLVRIRNGEVCYWSNLGYGRFGAKVSMDNAPWFDTPDQFDQSRVRLADIDGSGVTDILYLHRDGIRVYFNLSGNAWSQPATLPQLPVIDDFASIQAVDLLGNGTACLVWSSPLPGDMRPMRYIDLMNGQKPHLLVRSKNNLGAETTIRYAPSTRFYLDDKAAGKPWVTRLPFPVHTVERVEVFDQVSGHRFVSRYSYHHGYFDGVEREFRGFAMVEQLDTEELLPPDECAPVEAGNNQDAASYVPPIRTRTWFHTGAYTPGASISPRLVCEYYGAPEEPDGPEFDAFVQTLLPEPTLPDGLTLAEQREAARALKGVMLRQEVYALDGSDKAAHPYSVSEYSFGVDCVQPRATNKYAVFFQHPRESLSSYYERNPQDPRISHTLTLEVDRFGNVLKTVTASYGRTVSPLAEQYDRDQQTQTKVSYTESALTNAIDQPDDYRTPRPSEVRTYELTGYPRTGAAGRFQPSDLVKPDPADPAGKKLLHIFDNELKYEQQPTLGKQRRLFKQTRTLYRKDDLSAFLPQQSLEPLALPGESYTLCFTAGLLAQVYKRTLGNAPEENLLPDPAAILAGTGSDQGGYVDLDGDGNWWVPSGRSFYATNPVNAAAERDFARAHFFLPHRFHDPFGNPTTVEYDSDAADPAKNYNLLVVKTVDALGNTITAASDYRVLQHRQMTDPNGNTSEAVFDILGMLTGTAVRGKNGEGDSLTTFTADLTPTQIAEYFDAANPRPPAIDHLGSATSRIIYDLDRVPVCAAAILRETHVSDLAQGAVSAVQLRFIYSDGFGREIQQKIQAEPGPVPQRDAGGVIIVGADGQPVMTPGDANQRWVGTGWTVFNNKGKPVRRFEPFFSDTHRYESDLRIGVSSRLFYDPAGRVVATLHPNHTYEKVVFDPWQQTTYDANDTITFDPQTDADVNGFFTRLEDSEYLPTWHRQRIGGAMGAAEQQAAQKAAAHADTPATVHLDAQGRTILTFAHNRYRSNGTTVEEKYPTRLESDIEGNQLALRDTLVQNGDRLGRIAMRYMYDMVGNRIYQDSMDSGKRWLLNDVAGNPIRTWDSRGFLRRTTYDALRRLTGRFVTERNAERLAERTVYGESQGAANNHCTRVYQVFDGAGIVTSGAYDYKGNLLSSSRRFTESFTAVPDWSNNVPLEAETYTGQTRYDALNRLTQIVAPHSDQPGAKISVVEPTYNEANLLEQMHAWLDQQGEPAGLLDPATATMTVVQNIDYNAKGKRRLIEYGNGTRTTYDYDPLTFRLVRQQTVRSPDNAVLQDLSNTYDPSGNITHLQDDAQQTIYFRNKRVEPSADFTYDAIYRLVEATGREHLGQVGGTPVAYSYNDVPRTGILHPGDGNAMGTYIERYIYDAADNILEMQHRGSDPANPGWSRTYTYAETSMIEDGAGGSPLKTGNRLSRTAANPGDESYRYDAHGNMIRMPHLGGADPEANMFWNERDQLQQVNRGNGEAVYCYYNVAGQRVRKVWQKAANRIEERLYLGGFEIFRQRNGAGADVLVRETLDILDDQQRIAGIETRTLGDEPGVPARLVRFELRNYLGSAVLELDSQAAIISYEEYTPFGSTAYQAVRSQTETPKRYRYTGQERDEETGFYYYGARYYAPWLGRWISADPGGLIDGPNLYRYARNNPIVMNDPSGMDPQIKNDLDPNNPLNYIDFESFRQGAVGPMSDEGLRRIWDAAHPAQVAGPPPPPPPPPPATNTTTAEPAPPSTAMRWVNRGIGVLQMVGGGFEIAGGIGGGALTCLETFGGGCVVGGMLVLHGADTFTSGIGTVWSGEVSRTYTHRGIAATARVAGADERTADYIGAGGDLVVGLGGGLVARAPGTVVRVTEEVATEGASGTLTVGYRPFSVGPVSHNAVEIATDAGQTASYDLRAVQELNPLLQGTPSRFGPRGPMGADYWTVTFPATGSQIRAAGSAATQLGARGVVPWSVLGANCATDAAIVLRAGGASIPTWSISPTTLYLGAKFGQTPYVITVGGAAVAPPVADPRPQGQ